MGALPVDTLTLALILGVLLFGLVLLILVRRRRAAQPGARLRKCCRDILSQVHIPDGNDGLIHIEYALLCSRGIVLINLKQVSGNVFGSDAMQEWAVITGESRYGFKNPQDGLFDRIAAVKRMVPTVPVEGYIAFSHNAKFAKGVPNHVAMFDDLVKALEAENAETGSRVDAYAPLWEELKAVAVTST